ncbi:MAG TPA: hypothetical protein VFQ34_06985 [Nitrospiraceae bacterium]|nr:hypothetical protein [Nitrospiraceae bacterium]
MVGAGRATRAVACGSLALLIGCSADSFVPIPSASPPLAVYVAEDYSFTGPDTLPAGAATVRIQNRGREPHQIQLVKLEEGRSLRDMAAALSVTSGKLPPGVTQMGGPNAVSAGGTSEAQVSLSPGSYAIICMVPSHSGRTHAALGMVKAVRVVENDVPSPRTPSDYHVALREFEIVVVEAVKRGTHKFQVRNQGTQPHQVSLVKLNPGSSAQDIAAAFLPRTSTAVPGQLVGGMTGLEPGADGTFTATLSEGRYTFMCLFPDPASPDSHAAKGMVMNFTVE